MGASVPGSLPRILPVSQVRAAPRLPCPQPGSPFSASVGTRSSPPPSRRTKRGGGWSQPSRCPFFAGVCLLLLPEPAGSEGAGELRVPLSGKQGSVQAVGGVGGRQVEEARSDRAPRPWPQGPKLEGAKAAAAAWRTRIPTHNGSAPAYPFLPREGAPGVDGDALPKARRSKRPRTHTHTAGGTWQAELRHGKVKAGEYSLSPTEGHLVSGCPRRLRTGRSLPDPTSHCQS